MRSDNSTEVVSDEAVAEITDFVSQRRPRGQTSVGVFHYVDRVASQELKRDKRLSSYWVDVQTDPASKQYFQAKVVDLVNSSLKREDPQPVIDACRRIVETNADYSDADANVAWFLLTTGLYGVLNAQDPKLADEFLRYQSGLMEYQMNY